MREVGGGIVGYDVDAGTRKAAFALAGRLFLADLVYGGATELSTVGRVIDPRVDPTGSRVAYVTGGALHVVETDGTDGRLLIGEDTDDVTWGVAEFVAAEEMGRARGYWWAPGGRRLLVARVDESPVQRWHIADPAHPEQPAMVTRYPAAGTPNAVVTVAIVGLDGARLDVAWDTDALPYLAGAGWPDGRAPYVVVQSRDQRRLQVLQVDAQTGATTVVREDADPHWVDISAGVPAWLADGRLVWLADLDDTRRLWVGDEVCDSRGVAGLDGRGRGRRLGPPPRPSDESTERHLYRFSELAGLQRLTTVPGLYRGLAGGDLLARGVGHPRQAGTSWTISRADAERTRLDSSADVPALHPVPLLLRTGQREIRTAVVLPRDEVRPPGPLPVLMSPYGGPQGRMVVAARNAYLDHSGSPTRASRGSSPTAEAFTPANAAMRVHASWVASSLGSGVVCMWS